MPIVRTQTWRAHVHLFWIGVLLVWAVIVLALIGNTDAKTLNLNLGETADGVEFIFGQNWTNVGGTDGIASGNVVFSDGSAAAGVAVSAADFSGSGGSGFNPSDAAGNGFGGVNGLDSMTSSLLFAFSGSPKIEFDVTGLAGLFASDQADVSVWIGLQTQPTSRDLDLTINGSLIAENFHSQDNWTGGTVLTASGVDLSSGSLNFLVDGDVPHIQGIRITDGTGFEQQSGIEVNKVTGNVTLKNGALDHLMMRGYQLTSAAGLLDTNEWNSFEDQAFDGGTWDEANPSSSQLAELNLTSSSDLLLGEQRHLGEVYSGGLAGAEDLVFEYLPLGAITTVQLPISYSSVPPTLGDLNGDGAVGPDDASALVLALVDRAAYDAAYPAVAEEYVGDVNTDGQFDLGDVAPFQALLPSASASADRQNVPEQGGLALLGLGSLAFVGLLRRKRWPTSQEGAGPSFRVEDPLNCRPV